MRGHPCRRLLLPAVLFANLPSQVQPPGLPVLPDELPDDLVEHVRSLEVRTVPSVLEVIDLQPRDSGRSVTQDFGR